MAFNFESTSSAEMSNMVARIYKIHISCGGEVNEEIERIVQEQKEKKARQNDEKRLDEFEKLKCRIADLSEQILGKIQNNIERPTPEQTTQIQKMILGLNEPFHKMQDLQRACESRTGLWAKIKNPKPEIITQRREDIINIKKHIDNLKEKARGAKTIRIAEVEKKK